MNIILDDWQIEALEHEGDLLLCTGRQIGKTYILSRKCAERMLRQKTRIIIASLTEDQAKLIIVMILDYLERTNKKAIMKGKNKPTQNKISLYNGSTAIARPVGNTGDALRGFTSEILVLDEVSRFNELIMTAARPTLLSTGGDIWAASTPFGKQGWFWEQFQNKESRWKVIHKSSETAIAEREISESWNEQKRDKAIRFLEAEKRTMSQLQYGQEYMGMFMDDLRRLFSDELIEACCTLERRGVLPGKNYMGVDIARMGGDQITFEILHDPENGQAYQHVENITAKQLLTTETERRIIEITSRWKLNKVGIDAGAGTLGVSVLDHLLESPIKNKVVAINNRQIVMDNSEKPKHQKLLKEDLYYDLLAAMEKYKIYLLNDEEVKASLRSVQIDLGEDTEHPGLFTKTKIFGNNTHIVEGIIRALRLAKKEKSLNLWVRYN